MLRVGLTGGIACGKSHVLARLAARGFHALDLDRIAHEVTAPGGPAHAELLAAFGTGIVAPDGSVDRRRLGSLVFADVRARERLNAIVHPRVREEEERRAAAWSGQPAAIVVSDAALLVEAGVHLRFDRLVVVHCRPEQQLERLLARDGLDARAAQARIDAQLPIVEKRRFAHYEIDSSGSFEDTAREAERVAVALERLAREARPQVSLKLEQASAALALGPRHGPRGLTPLLVLDEIVAASGLELARLSRRLEPPSREPWYRAGLAAEPGPAPATLQAPVAIWSLFRGAPDPPFVYAAAASLARLTHRDGEAIASACLFARALLEVAIAGGVPPDLASRAAGWEAEARRWGGHPPAGSLAQVFEAAARWRPDRPLASADPDGLTGALVGLAGGASSTGGEPWALEAIARLARRYGAPHSA
jgi:dephospho-CoA kinase